MATLNTYQIIRRSKVAITFMVGILGLLIVFSNLSDYNSNYVFVGHVLSMDTTGSHLMYRSIDSEIMHHRIYWMIMTLETILPLLACMALINSSPISTPVRKHFIAQKNMQFWVSSRACSSITSAFRLLVTNGLTWINPKTGTPCHGRKVLLTFFSLR